MRSQKADWERVRVLGGGGQSEVYLVRNPERTMSRAHSLYLIGTVPPGMMTVTVEERANKSIEYVEAIRDRTRADETHELGAMKEFKIRNDQQQSLSRLKQEISVLQETRPGLPKLLDYNEDERWMVTEYFPNLTLQHHMSKYRGKPGLALKAFQSLVKIVADLHQEGIVHRDIKPLNIFVRREHELVLGDFGIVFVPNQPIRITFSNESVGASDFLPPWAAMGTRLEDVGTNFDVYMLGKLLWCMVSGHPFLRREWFKRPEFDVTNMFRNDPHAYMINKILEKCVVERPENCLHSAVDLKLMVDAYVAVIEQGGQLLHDEVPRPCHICGYGNYERQELVKDTPFYGLRFWSGGADTTSILVELFMCDKCGHTEFFRAKQR